MNLTVLQGDCRETLKTLPDESVHCAVTSPPYWGLRDYGTGGQMGLEPSPEEYVGKMVEVFREVRRVMRKDGTLWLNVGDSYNAYNGNRGLATGSPNKNHHNIMPKLPKGAGLTVKNLKSKDLIGIPWMLAFALRADGWYLRSDIVWGKPNGMPESVQDRPTRAHEYVFLLSKSPTYYYDYDAVRLPPLPSSIERLKQHVEAQAGSARANAGGKTNGTMKAVAGKQRGHSRRHDGRWDAMEKEQQQVNGCALRDVWWLSPAQFAEGHFAVMPDHLAQLCIMAGCPVGGTVLDPFGGVFTTALAAIRMGRKAIMCELSSEYIQLGRKRLMEEIPMFVQEDG